MRRNARHWTSIGLAIAAVCAAGVFAQAAEPQRGGILTAAVEITPNSLDPIFGNSSFYDRYVYSQLYENLFYQDEKGNFTPALATSWQVAPDGMSITIKLREGVIFHDGTPFDAEAVKVNLDRVMDPATKAFARVNVLDMKSTDVVDPLTVRVNLKNPSGALMAGLAGAAGMIVSPTALKKFGADFRRNPVGTGPFQFVKWTEGDRVDVKRFDKYWMKDEAGGQLPYLDGVATRLIVNSTVKIVEVRSGNVQIGDVVQDKDYAQIERDPNSELMPNPVGIAQYLAFPYQKPPMDNIKLRQAVSLAINRAALNKVITNDTGILTPTVEIPSSWSFDASLKQHPFDLAMARQLYKESGHTGPLNMICAQRDLDLKIAQILQSQLREAGMTVTIEPLERQAFFERGITQKFDLMMQRTSMPVPDPDMYYSANYGKNASVNYAGIKDQAIIDAVETARVTVDQNKRKELYSEVQKRLLDNYYQTFFFFRPNKGLKRKNLNGVELDYMGAWRFQKAWFAGTLPK